MFFLHCADFFPKLERRLIGVITEAQASLGAPNLRPILIVVPTSAVRKRLLTIIAAGIPQSLAAVNIFSINQLAIRIVLDSSRKPNRLISDPLFFPFALYQLARTKNIHRFNNFRTCLALYQTLRDLSDGGITAELFQQILEESKSDPDLDFLMKVSDSSSLSQIYTEFEKFLQRHNLLNLQMPSAAAANLADSWISSKDFSSVIIYGFYDSTETQLELLEKFIRGTHRKDRSAHFFFPFRVSWNNQPEHPGEFALAFFQRIHSLTSALNGGFKSDNDVHHLASGGVETLLSSDSTTEREIESVRASNNIEVFHAGGVYDEVWGITKRILQLVRTENVSFDQIIVITRSLENHLIPITHIFEENRIPCSLTKSNSLSSLPFARFAYSVLQARLSRLSPSTLFELLSSSFLKQPSFRDLRNLEAIFSGLLIRNWDDWERISPLLQSEELPQIFEFVQPEQLESFRGSVIYLQELRKRLQVIPEKTTLPEFAESLRSSLENISQLSDKDDADPVFQLLEQIADYSMLGGAPIELSEFINILKSYFQRSLYETEEDDNSAKVIVGDIMQLRGITADYVFVAGLNKEIFPRRAYEDPFLPDRTRDRLRDISGTGPAPKRADKRLLPSKEGSAEELLLFSLALRAARKKLFLSYQRADNLGRKLAASGYLDEISRALTGKTCDQNSEIINLPKHHKTKFLDQNILRANVLPTPAECAMLTDYFSLPQLASQIYELTPLYVDHLVDFARGMNSFQRQDALEVDGCISDPEEMWSNVLQGKDALRISYSRLKSYLECPFKFLAATILGLVESPKDGEEEDHDLSQLMKGLISEDVVKRALRFMRDENLKRDQAIVEAARQVRAKYSSIFPSLLLDSHLQLFQTGASNLIEFLQDSGYDLRKTQIPGRNEIGEVILVAGDGAMPPIVIKGIPDFIFQKSNGEGLVVDLKWKTRNVTKTLKMIYGNSEAQFCIYPAIVNTQSGNYFPFSYYRLDAFGMYGSPTKIRKKIFGLTGEEDLRVVLRTFGKDAEVLECRQFFDQTANEKAHELLHGTFRIIDDPNSGFSVCRYCDFTQICRRTHTATLLRSKKVEQTQEVDPS